MMATMPSLVRARSGQSHAAVPSNAKPRPRFSSASRGPSQFHSLEGSCPRVNTLISNRLRRMHMVAAGSKGSPPTAKASGDGNANSETMNEAVLKATVEQDSMEEDTTASPEGKALADLSVDPLVTLPNDETKVEIDAEGESMRRAFRLNEDMKPTWMRNVLGVEDAEGVLGMSLEDVRSKTSNLLSKLGVHTKYPEGSPARAIFCNRILNLRSIQAIGYDMDYTLIHYDAIAWEGLTYEYGLDYLRSIGCPVEGMEFNSDLVIRGLILDKKLGNLIKVDRFGFVKRAMHGTKMLNAKQIKDSYGRDLVQLGNSSRYKFVNTLFSISESVMFAQLVDRFDSGALPDFVLGGDRTYTAVYELVENALIMSWVEGQLKQQIIENPDKFVKLDPEAAAALLDQVNAGMSLVLITNSDLQYTERMMSYAFDRFLPEDMVWQDLFEIVIVQARKPGFFTSARANAQTGQAPENLFEIVSEDGLMRPVPKAHKGGIFCGGTATQVEEALGVSGDAVLYIGDHIYTDAALVSKNMKWRTALVVRELEQEVKALSMGRPHREKLKGLLAKKELLGDVFNTVRTQRQRRLSEQALGEISPMLEDVELVDEALGQLLLHIQELDAEIAPMVEDDGSAFNKRWGYLSRAGVNDRSILQLQIEKYADIYTSRVSNFARSTPYSYFRSPLQTLAHDRNLTSYTSRLAEWDPEAISLSMDELSE